MDFFLSLSLVYLFFTLMEHKLIKNDITEKYKMAEVKQEALAHFLKVILLKDSFFQAQIMQILAQIYGHKSNSLSSILHGIAIQPDRPHTH